MNTNTVIGTNGPFYFGASGVTPTEAFKNLEALYLDLRPRYVSDDKEKTIDAPTPQETPSAPSSIILQKVTRDARDLTREETVRWFYEITPEARKATKLIAAHRHGYTFPELQADMDNPPTLSNSLASVGHAANRLGFKDKITKAWCVRPMFNTVQVKGVYRYRMNDSIADIVTALPITPQV